MQGLSGGTTALDVVETAIFLATSFSDET